MNDTSATEESWDAHVERVVAEEAARIRARWAAERPEVAGLAPEAAAIIARAVLGYPPKHWSEEVVVDAE